MNDEKSFPKESQKSHVNVSENP